MRAGRPWPQDLRPTPEGQVVLQHALSLVHGAALLSSEVTRMTKLDAGDLRFGCGPAPAVKLVPDAVARFINAHPKIRTTFQVDNWETLSRRLSREEIEFFIADIRQFEADPNFQTRALTPNAGCFLPPWASFAGQGQPVHQRYVRLPAGGAADLPRHSQTAGEPEWAYGFFTEHPDRALPGTGEHRAANQCHRRRH